MFLHQHAGQRLQSTNQSKIAVNRLILSAKSLQVFAHRHTAAFLQTKLMFRILSREAGPELIQWIQLNLPDYSICGALHQAQYRIGTVTPLNTVRCVGCKCYFCHEQHKNSPLLMFWQVLSGPWLDRRNCYHVIQHICLCKIQANLPIRRDVRKLKGFWRLI